MMKFIPLSVLALALLGCSLLEYDPAIDVTAVSCDWNNTVQSDVRFTVWNTGDVALDSIDIHFIAQCCGGTFSHIATFPNMLFDVDSPVAMGSICYVGKALATLAGGATCIIITQVSVGYEMTLHRLLTYTKTFRKP